MAKSLHCSPEATTILFIGYTPIQNIQLFKNCIFKNGISWQSSESQALTAKGPGSIPDQGTKIPQVMRCGPNKKKKAKTFRVLCRSFLTSHTSPKSHCKPQMVHWQLGEPSTPTPPRPRQATLEKASGTRVIGWVVNFCILQEPYKPQLFSECLHW